MSQNPPSLLHLKVITSHRLFVDAQVVEVSLPGLEGYLGILPGHRPLFVALGQGTLSYRETSGEKKFSVRSGYAEVQPARVLVFTELDQDEKDESPGG
jgi:F-type H+-transporting ATPase subunit epsilon